MNDNDIPELSGIGVFYRGQDSSVRALFSDPENKDKAEGFPVQENNPIVEISVGYNDDNTE